MRNLLNSFVETINNNEEFKRRLADYERVSKSPQWQFVRDVLLTVKGTMLTDMYSSKFTNLDPTEKDVQQRAYYQINQLLEFLMQPTRWIKFKRRFLPTTRQGETKPKGRT
ncbi:hypothetical protein KAR91_84470 [Candidatus Pacearchaeota archaeon]|nr:hypothetical protein [Candidatus Pacearchaeota archaeon]